MSPETIARKVEGCSRAASHFAVRQARRVLIVAAIFTLLPLGGLTRLRRDTDANTLVPSKDPAVRIDRTLRARFDLRDQIIIYIDTHRHNGIFDASVLGAVRAISDEIAAIPEIGHEHVMSLATEARDRLVPGSGETFGSFVSTIPSTRREMEELRADLALPSARLAEGTIVTRDRSGTAIHTGVPDDADRAAIVREVEAAVEPYRRAGLSIDVVGAPVAEVLLAGSIARDLMLLVPLSMLVICTVIAAGTRRAAPAVMALVKVGLCIGFTFGMLGWLGIPLYLTATIVPVILAAACIADEIHLVLRFQRALHEHGDADRAAAATIDDLALPVVAATLTTCIGFLSCTASSIEPVRALGIASALGIGWSLLFSLFVTPALFVTLPARWFALREQASAPGLLPVRTGGEVRAPRLTLAVLVAITVIALAGATRVEIQDSWIECFAPRSELRRATERVNGALQGVHLLHAAVSFPDDAMRNPENLRLLGELESLLRTHDTVGGVIGAASQVAAVAEFWRLRDALGSSRELERLYHRFDLSPGLARRRRAVTDARDGAVVTIFLENASFRSTAAILAAIRRFERDRLAPRGARVELAGDIAVSQAMIPAVVRSQIFSLPLALLGVFLTVMLLCGSLRLAAYAILPAALSGLWILGALGLMRVPLGVAVSMFFVISIGLGVDSHSVHLIVRFRQLGDAAASLRAVARSVVINTAAVASGFGLVALSNVPPNRRLGLLIAAGLVAGCAITFTGLPALLALQRGSRQTAVPAVPGPYHKQEVAP